MLEFRIGEMVGLELGFFWSVGLVFDFFFFEGAIFNQFNHTVLQDTLPNSHRVYSFDFVFANLKSDVLLN